RWTASARRARGRSARSATSGDTPATTTGSAERSPDRARRRIVVTVTEQLNPALKAVSDAVLAIGAELSVEEVLQNLVQSARTLVDARYAALGIPDDDGGFSAFLTSGMSDKLIASLGPLPPTRGMLG